MKQLFFFFLLLFLALPCDATIITGEVEYNAEDIREELFSSPLKPFNINSIKNHLIDINAEENINAISLGIQELKDRKIAGFSDGSYGIVYFEDPLYAWYYKHGRLINFTKKSSENYPCQITKYKPDGNIANTGYKVSENESFIYSQNGKLIAHWKNNLCYDENNNVIMARKSL